MELIKSAARRTRFGELSHAILNVAYAGLLLLLVVGFDGQPYLAYLAVILSKWRVLAVRPRFWIANLRTNLLDTMVGLSMVTLVWQNTGNIVYQIVLTILFAIWLVFIKPKSKRKWIILQGTIAQFVAVAALFTVAHALNVAVVTLVGGLIGYVVARHIINAYSEELEDVLVSVSWGLVVAELCWLAYYWTIAYTPLKIPQVAIIVTLIGFMSLVVYDYMYHHTTLKNIWKDRMMPIAFSLIGVLLLLVIFNAFDPTGI